MAKKEYQKIKLLKIYDILRTESDEENPLSTNDIISKLAEDNISCGRKALKRDMDMLAEFGYGVQVKRSRQNEYYLENRDLDIHTIRFLMDATQSATFLSKGQTRDIVSRLEMLAGTNRAELLNDHVICFDKLKHSNNEVLSSITLLDRAIEKEQKVSFEYYMINVNGEPELKTANGQIRRYVELPIALIYSGSCYYLITYQEKYDDFVSFRVDRMRSVRVEKEKFDYDKYKQRLKNSDIKDSMTTFGMWTGKTASVKLCLPNRHASDVFDKFGNQAKLHTQKDGRFTVTVKVNPDDPVFLGWCMSYGDELEVIYPEEVKKSLLDKAEAICRMYKR